MDRGQGRCLFAAEGFKSKVEATGVADPSTGPAGLLLGDPRSTLSMTGDRDRRGVRTHDGGSAGLPC
jgi:hypothetical protein